MTKKLLVIFLIFAVSMLLSASAFASSDGKYWSISQINKSHYGTKVIASRGLLVFDSSWNGFSNAGATAYFISGKSIYSYFAKSCKKKNRCSFSISIEGTIYGYGYAIVLVKRKGHRIEDMAKMADGGVVIFALQRSSEGYGPAITHISDFCGATFVTISKHFNYGSSTGKYVKY